MSKKVIEQDFFLYIGDIEISTDTDGDVEILQWNKERECGCDIITVGKSKATEVAKAIDPNYQKVIDALNTLVQLKDIKGIPEMAEKYGSMKPKAWEQARQILKELNV